jgi:hypothetical protein
MQASRPLPYDYDVVTRRVDGTLSETRRLVEASAARSAQLRIDAPFTAVGALRSWHTTGRLYAPGIRIARYTRVNLEITAWSAHTTEVRLRPVTRRIPNWGKQRQRRYFALAHRTVDELCAFARPRSYILSSEATISGRPDAAQRGREQTARRALPVARHARTG